MRTTTIVCCLFAAALSACGGGAAAQSSAGKTAAALTGEDKIAADKNPQCHIFTPAELAKYAGEPLGPGHDAAMGTGCQFEGRSESGSVMIQVAPARYHEPHKGAAGFKWLPEIGTKGFVETAMGGWNAGAISGEKTVVVSVSGPSASESNAIALLTETLKRRK